MKKMHYTFLILALLVLAPFIWVRLNRPPRQTMTRELANGAIYQRTVFNDPNVIAHVVKIDLVQTGAQFIVTPASIDNGYTSLKTSTFLNQFGAEIAINGSFYQENRQTGAQQPIGIVISNGIEENNGRSRYPALCISANNQITVSNSGLCPEGTQQAIAGNVLLIENGTPLDVRNSRFPGRGNAFRPQPRTAVGLSADGQTVWLVVIDGRQGRYSVGMTLAELAEFMMGLGVETAVNLDGGGSSTLVTQSWRGPIIRNSPIHNGIPTLQRPIPTHLGVSFRANPTELNTD